MIKLIRNLETKRNKEQEESFEENMNSSLYFSSNKLINKIDGWKISNIKNLIKVINKENNLNLEIEFSSWNKNLINLHKELKVEIINPKELDAININSFIERDIYSIHNLIKEAKENKNLKLAILITMAEIIGDEKSMEIANMSINESIPTLDVAIDSLLPKLLMGEKNE